MRSAISRGPLPNYASEAMGPDLRLTPSTHKDKDQIEASLLDKALVRAGIGLYGRGGRIRPCGERDHLHALEHRLPRLWRPANHAST